LIAEASRVQGWWLPLAVAFVACGDDLSPGKGFDSPGERIDIPVGPTPTAIVVADFDRDDVPDLAVKSLDWSLEAGTIRLLLGDGAGNFETAGDLVASVNASWLVSGDFDGNGAVDLAEFPSDSMGPLLPWIYWGDGDGGFQMESLFGPGYYAGAAQSGDFDEDGHDDLAAIVWDDLAGTERSVEILFGPDFSRRDLHDDLDGLTIATGDLDGDGHADLAFNAGLSLGSGDGGFSALRPVPLPVDVSDRRTSLHIADLDGDGAQDLVATPPAGAEIAELYVLFADGGGDLAPAISLPILNFGARAIGSGDLDGDGRLDLVVGHEGTRLSVLFGVGVEEFAAPRQIRVAGMTADLEVADLDGDARPEIVVTNGDDGTISVLRPDF
jgi:hypothetical protein